MLTYVRVATMAACLVACGMVAAPAAHADTLAPIQPPSGEVIPGKYIVTLKANANPSAASASVRSRGGAEVVELGAVKAVTARLDAKSLSRVRSDANVAFVEPDQIVSATEVQANPAWGLDRIDQPSLPLSRSYTYNFTGTGVNAYIIDTGVGAHSQFTGRYGSYYDAIARTTRTTFSDCNGHGTHVAGTIGGSTVGVAKGVRINAVRVLGCDGRGSLSGVIAGMDWVTANSVKPAVANMSLGGGYSAAENSAVARMTSSGVTLVAAAGNSNANACSTSPASAPSAITVGATSSNDARASFSNYGSCLDIFAPGVSITSAWPTSPTAYRSLSGTSMASPHVAGVVALYLQTNPNASVAQVTQALKSKAVANKVTSSAGSPNLLLQTFL